MDEQLILSALRQIVGEKNVFTDDVHRKKYGTDKTPQFLPNPLAVVFPLSIENVRDIVIAANRMGFSIVPSGGRTGLCAGATAIAREVIVSMERMNQVLGFNALERVLHCQAGVITQNIEDIANRHGLHFPIDIASAGSSHIGGNIATNAGGSRVIRYGMMERYIRALTVVTGAGEILKLGGGLKKNNTGYDVMRLFAGSEGTLGIICETEVELVAFPQNHTLLMGFGSFRQVIEFFEKCQSNLQILCFEYMSAPAMQAVCVAQQYRMPFAHPYEHFVLVEHDGEKLLLEQTANAFCQSASLCDGIVAGHQAQARQLKAYRENISMSIAPMKPIKCDIAVRLSAIEAFRDGLLELDSRYKEWNLVLFGHIGDGNLHVNFLPGSPSAEHQRLEFESQIYKLVADHKGSLSAEHGIGLTKKELLAYYESDQRLAVLKKLKAVFDPAGVMNPGKIFNG